MICEMSLETLAERCNGTLIGRNLSFDSVSIDSRAISPGALYVALPGENFDGHDYVDAVANTASAAVVENEQGASIPQVVVPDSRRALGVISGFCREQYQGAVIAITGSSGKTTARKMLTSILSTQGAVCSSIGNQNNEIGVPLTLLSLKETDRNAVVEIGARHRGDIAYLGEFVQPNISILLNAGSAHIGEFGGYENIVLGKGEIYTIIKQNGVAVVNLDDPAADVWINSLDHQTLMTFSIDKPEATIFASDIQLSAKSASFYLNANGESQFVTLNVSGMHSVSNALAVSAAAVALDVSLLDIAEGLGRYESEPGRLAYIKLNSNLSIIDDSYNANPASMKAALDVLDLESGHRIAILGEMAELGSDANMFHLQVAEKASQSTIEEFWLIGQFAQVMAEKIGARATTFADKRQIVEALRARSNQPIMVLIKASRAAALEEIIDNYKQDKN